MKQRVAALTSKAQDALPTGAASVGVGIIISAATAYIFVIITLNSLDTGPKAAFSAFWAVIFVVGPGFFLPIEQEVGRAIAHRRAQGQGSRPLVIKAFKLGIAITIALVVLSVAFAPILGHEIYKGDQTFTIALVISLVAFFLVSLAKGVLAGEGRFRPYAELLAVDGIVRLVLAVGLAGMGAKNAGLYALCIGVSMLIALPVAWRGQRGILQPGPDAPLRELSANLGWLLAGSVLMQALAYSALLGVNILGTPADEVIVAGFASAFFIARIPVLAFQAIQGTLLPKLAGLAGAGKHDEFRSAFQKLLLLVIGVAIVGALAAFLLGPAIGKILFKDFTMGAGGLGLLAAGSGMFIVALTLAQALMALGGHRVTAIAWGVGVIVCLALMAVISGLEARVDIGFLVGSAATAVVMFIGVIRFRGRMEGMGVEGLVTAIEEQPIEI